MNGRTFRPWRDGLILTVLLLGLGCDRRSPPPAARDKQSSVVEVVPVAVRDIHHRVTIPVTLESHYRVALAARVEAYVESIAVDIGDDVAAGQPLVRLRAGELQKEAERLQRGVVLANQRGAAEQAAVERATAQLRQAESHAAAAEAERRLRLSERNRIAKLVAAGSLPRARADEAGYALERAQAMVQQIASDVDAARAQLDEARQQLKAAIAAVDVARAAAERGEAMLEYLTLSVPFDGIVTERRVAPGDLVRPQGDGGGALMTVEQIDPLRLVLFLPMQDAAWLNRGDPVLLRDVPRAPGQSFGPFDIARVSQVFQAGSRMMRAEADVPNALQNGERPLRPGDYGKAQVTLHVFRQALVVPQRAVGSGSDGPFVVVVDEDGICHRVSVRIVHRMENEVVVRGVMTPLEGGQYVVASDPQAWHDGERAERVEGRAAAKP